MDERWSLVRWGWRWIALFVVLSGAAYFLAYLLAPSDLVFLGFLANNDDNQLYLSYMRDGADGAWLVSVRSTPEPHDPALLLPVYPVLGKVARVLGLSNELIFHTARLASGVALLASVYWLCSLTLPGVAARRNALLMAAFSSGLGWLLVVLRLADTVLVPVDIRIPEANTFLTVFSSPHFALGITLEVLCFAFFLSADWRGGYLVASAVSLLLLSITLVYNVIVVAAALIVYTVVRVIQRPRDAGRALLRAAAVGLPSVPIVVYYYLLLSLDPFWSAVYRARLVFPTVGLPALAAGYGLVLCLALWGLIHWIRERQWSGPRVLLGGWVVANGLLVYAPFAFQGRLMAGWHVGMCVLAAVGLHDGLLPWAAQQRWFRHWMRQSPRALVTARNVVLILTVPSTLLVALLGLRIALAEHYFPYYLPAADVRAVEWLAGQTDEQAVLLSSYGIGSYWAAHSAGRALLGHQFATVAPEEKARAVRRFYSGEASVQEMRDLSRSLGATHVFHGTLERGLGPLRAEGLPWLRLIYSEEGVAVYVVEVDEA